MATYSDAQIAQLIADHAALKDEVAALKGALRGVTDGYASLLRSEFTVDEHDPASGDEDIQRARALLGDNA